MDLPGASKPIEMVKNYENYGDDYVLIWSRNELDPNGPIVARRVLRKFVRVSPVLKLHLPGRIIGTTAEHPFYVESKGWRSAAMIQIGERVMLKSSGSSISDRRPPHQRQEAKRPLHPLGRPARLARRTDRRVREPFAAAFLGDVHGKRRDAAAGD